MPSVDQLLASARASMARRDFISAKVVLHELLGKQAGNAEALLMLGGAEMESGRFAEAEPVLRRCVKARPGAPEGWLSLGQSLMYQLRPAEALEPLARAAALRASWDVPWFEIGRARKMMGEAAGAADAFGEAEKRNPRNMRSVSMLSGCLLEQGLIAEAVAACERAVALDPREPALRSALAMALNYVDGEPARVRAAHVEAGLVLIERFAPAGAAAHVNHRDPDRPLRVGVISPDFWTHSCAYFMQALVGGLRAAGQEVYCYADVQRPDALTERFRSLASGWRDIYKVDAAKAAGLVRADAIDVLIECAGHTGANRLDVCCHKPAPVQVSYLGYPNTTGLATIDYRLVDAVTDPMGDADSHCTEKLLRLPGCLWCFTPSAEAPEVSPLPAAGRGALCFGSFNNLSKITPDVVAAWCRVLRGVPGSTLLLKNRFVHEARSRDRLLAMFGAGGVEPSRIEIAPYTANTREHLGLYSRVDIQLDTFPYNGTTTTCESFWQGVPVVTLEGRVHAARVGMSLCAAVGLGDWVGRSVDEYVEIARRMGGDIGALGRLRTGLRERLRASELMDERRFGEQVTGAMRVAWRGWCGA